MFRIPLDPHGCVISNPIMRSCEVMLAGQHLTERVRLLDDASVATVPRSLRLNLRVAVVTICAYAEAYPGVWMQL